MHTIIVHMADPQWTARAMHLACGIAQQYKAQIVLLRLIPVPNPGWLGAGPGEAIPTGQDTSDYAFYKAIAKDYQVDCTVQRMQYFTLDGALMDAADLWDAQMIFAQLPKSIIPYWDKLRWWNMKRRLSAHNRQLNTLNEPADSSYSMPSKGSHMS